MALKGINQPVICRFAVFRIQCIQLRGKVAADILRKRSQAATQQLAALRLFVFRYQFTERNMLTRAVRREIVETIQPRRYINANRLVWFVPAISVRVALPVLPGYGGGGEGARRPRVAVVIAHNPDMQL